MKFIDWRKPHPEETTDVQTDEQVRKRRGKKYHDYVEEIIQEAQQRGEFSNLPGEGKPLQLEDESAAGDKALGYHMLKNSGFAPAEVELAKEIRKELERADVKLKRIIQQGQTLRSRRVSPFASEKRAFNASVESAAEEYERTLRELNRKILTLNLMAPAAMHHELQPVEALVRQFREACPLFDV